jgi:hypothetical protein
MDPKRFEECIFYLNTYGSYSGVVTFYVNHNHLKLACRFILEKVYMRFILQTNVNITIVKIINIIVFSVVGNFQLISPI